MIKYLEDTVSFIRYGMDLVKRRSKINLHILERSNEFLGYYKIPCSDLLSYIYEQNLLFHSKIFILFGIMYHLQ